MTRNIRVLIQCIMRIIEMSSYKTKEYTQDINLTFAKKYNGEKDEIILVSLQSLLAVLPRYDE